MLPTRSTNTVVEACSQELQLLVAQGPNMIKGEYPTAFPLKHQHKDLRLALELADTGTLAELPLAKLTEAIYRQGARFHHGTQRASSEDRLWPMVGTSQGWGQLCCKRNPNTACVLTFRPRVACPS